MPESTRTDYESGVGAGVVTKKCDRCQWDREVYEMWDARLARKVRSLTMRLLARAHLVNVPLTEDPPPVLEGLEVKPWGGVRSGIYFLLLGNQVVYVGQSVCVDARIPGHVGHKAFDRAWWLPCEPARLDELEDHYISHFKPPMNGRGAPRSRGSRRLEQAAPASPRCHGRGDA